MKTHEYKNHPDTIDYEAMFRTLNDGLLAAYQLFYFEGLTSPTGHPWRIQLHFPTPTIANAFVARHDRRGDSGFYVIERTPQALLAKVKLLLPVLAVPTNLHACCPLAEHIACVCVYASKCPVHGDRHIGTHD